MPRVRPSVRLHYARRLAEVYDVPLSVIMSERELRDLLAETDREWFDTHVRPHGGNT